MISQGPHSSCPDVPPPPPARTIGSPDARWCEMPDGTWWAFYHQAVGPSRTHGQASSENYLWYQQTSGMKFFCRHGSGTCPDKTCGTSTVSPVNEPSPGEVKAAVSGLRRILGDAQPEEDEGIELYAHDLTEIVHLIAKLNAALDTEDAYVAGATVIVASRNDYQIGTLRYVEEQWRFTPHVADSPESLLS